MDKAEFDRFAEEYRNLHRDNIKVSGENPEFFAEYKVKDLAQILSKRGLSKKVNILDFGAGVGNSIPFFQKHIPEARLTCLDVSIKSLDIAKERFPGTTEFIVFDGKEIPISNNKFDIVFSACVFHHIPEQKHIELLKQLFRVLKPSGMLVIFEHNPYNPLTVRAVNTCPFDENAVLIKANTLMGRIKKSGFEKVTKKYRIFFPGVLSAFRPLETALTRFPLGAQYYVLAEKT